MSRDSPAPGLVVVGGVILLLESSIIPALVVVGGAIVLLGASIIPVMVLISTRLRMS